MKSATEHPSLDHVFKQEWPRPEARRQASQQCEHATHVLPSPVLGWLTTCTSELPKLLDRLSKQWIYNISNVSVVLATLEVQVGVLRASLSLS